ncbi:toll/interleukin-1 receptor domain-containing protein [Streptomyces sp. NPDC047002]|uniref:toll/interleukin-1 receptor domain-containing protein n=1 Tax=Streptomyces sp. NPDC047002 TaxID=3155475 RepID=UPI003454CA80
MPYNADVFINYRTKDGEHVAGQLYESITKRFGDDRVFRDGSTLTPGRPFPTGIMDALHASSVCIAVVGEGWAASPLLRREDDYVRRELLEALERGITVLPVLIDKTPWLKAADLPPELARLAEIQAMRLRAYDSRHDLAEIGDYLSDMVPALRTSDREGEQKEDKPSGSVNNAAGDNTGSGTLIQTRDTGDIDTSTHTNTTSIGRAGHVHSGSGDQHNTAPQHAPHLGHGSFYVAGDQSGGGNTNTFHYGERDRDGDR